MRLIGLALLLIPLFARAMSLLSMLPGWDLDPLLMPMPFTGIGPAESITLDGIALIGAAILAAFAPRAAQRVDWLIVTLLILGVAGVLLHATVRSGLPESGTLGDRRIGIAWLSAIFGAGAIWLCRRDESLQRVAAAVLLGFVGMLVAKAAQQILIEHPLTVQAYRADPARYLAGQGLLPDTPMARGFERRLLQAEATGWFGLANVFATIMAAATVTAAAFVALALLRRPRLPAVPTTILALTALATIFGLSTAGAKGGALSAAVGFSGLLLAAASAKLTLTPRSRTLLGSAFGLAAILGPVALIIVRGLIGERIGELSLLFRWFYMQGATRIFAGNLLGVGPDGFQQAYLLAKPPISPEEVTSPHSIMFDWLADLGIPGIAWILLLLIAAVAIGRVLAAAPAAPQAAPTPLPPAPPARSEVRLILLIPGVATLLAAWLERGAVTPDGALVRLFGLVAWCTIAWAVLTLARAKPAWPTAFAAGAAALLAHIQIDVAATWPQSTGLVFILIALAASALRPPHAPTASRDVQPPAASRGRLPASWVLAFVAGLAAVLLFPHRTWKWQTGLLAGKQSLEQVADLNQRFESLAAGDATVSPADLAESVAAALRQRLPQSAAAPILAPRTGEELRLAMARLESIDLDIAARHLLAATSNHPGEWRTRREASRLYLRAASAVQAAGDQSLLWKHLDSAVSAMSLPDALKPDSPNLSTGTAPEWRWLAIVHQTRSTIGIETSEKTLDLQRAAASLELAAALDPYNIEIALRLMRVYTQLGDAPGASAAAAAWAGKVLELDPLMRLDKVARGLTDTERAEAHRTLQRP